MDVITGCLVVDDNKVLLVKEGLKDHYGMWNIPAGKLENFEKVTDGAKREVFEETGLKVELVGVLPIGIRIIKDKTFISVRFIARKVSGEIKFDSNEIIDVKWFDINDVKNMKDDTLRSYEFNKQVINNYLDNKIYPIEIFDDKKYID